MGGIGSEEGKGEGGRRRKKGLIDKATHCALLHVFLSNSDGSLHALLQCSRVDVSQLLWIGTTPSRPHPPHSPHQHKGKSTYASTLIRGRSLGARLAHLS